MKRSTSQRSLSKLFNEWGCLVLGIGSWLLIGAAGAVSGNLVQWSPGELIGLVAVLAAAAVAAIGFFCWHRARLAQAQANLKLNMLQRGLTTDEIERLLSGQSGDKEVPATEEQAMQQLAECLRDSNVSARVIEQVFAAVRRTDPPVRQSLCAAICGMAISENEIPHIHAPQIEKRILAAIRGWCGESSPLDDVQVLPHKDSRTNDDSVAFRAGPGVAADRPRD
jgi:hypothetical protein